MGAPVHQQRGEHAPPAVEPHPRAVAEHALHRPRRLRPAGPDLVAIPLEVAPRPRDAHTAFLRAPWTTGSRDAQTPRVVMHPGRRHFEGSSLRQVLKDCVGRNGQITARKRVRLHLSTSPGTPAPMLSRHRRSPGRSSRWRDSQTGLLLRQSRLGRVHEATLAREVGHLGRESGPDRRGNDPKPREVYATTLRWSPR